jgi:hypothetical protein
MISCVVAARRRSRLLGAWIIIVILLLGRLDPAQAAGPASDRAAQRCELDIR